MRLWRTGEVLDDIARRNLLFSERYPSFDAKFAMRKLLKEARAGEIWLSELGNEEGAHACRDFWKQAAKQGLKDCPRDARLWLYAYAPWLLLPLRTIDPVSYTHLIRSLYKLLRPGGVALVTVPGISPIIKGGLVAGIGEDWWRFTGRSAQLEFAQVFGTENVVVQTYGNVLSATAFLHGLVQEELTQEELEYHDANYEVLIGVMAIKQGAR